MRIEEELKMENFASEQIKAELNLLFTAGWLYSKIAMLLKKYNLSNEQFNVLRILRGQKGNAICQKDILARMLNHNSNLTTIVRKLAEKKMIEVVRSVSDKREYKIKILNAGIIILTKLDAELANAENIPANLNDSEAFHLNALLDKFREHKNSAKN